MHLRAGALHGAASGSIKDSLKAALRAGIAAGAVSLAMLSACGPASREAQRKPSTAAQECMLTVPSNGSVTIDVAGSGKAKGLSSYTILVYAIPAPVQKPEQIAITGSNSHSSEYLNGKLSSKYDHSTRKVVFSDIEILFIGISGRQSSASELAADAKMGLPSLLSLPGLISRWPAPGASSLAACIANSSIYATGSNIEIIYGAPLKHSQSSSSFAF